MSARKVKSLYKDKGARAHREHRSKKGRENFKDGKIGYTVGYGVHKKMKRMKEQWKVSEMEKDLQTSSI